MHNPSGASLREIRAIRSLIVLLVLSASISSCKSHYEMTGITRTRILIDSVYDRQPDQAAAQFLAPYTRVVDSLMNPIVGETAEYLEVDRPESRLTNLASDILVWVGKRFNEKPDFGVYNKGGVRSALPKGKITKGDILDMAPFENKICFLTLTGEKVLQLFREMAGNGGEGVSHSVRMVITRDGKLVSATINGKPVDPQASYRIATLDYVAQGNDKMEAFKSKTQVVSPQGEKDNIRYFIMDYFEEQMKAGRKVDAQIEGRITVK